MDYCSSCRRHLNSVLVCPGCGAYAPGIAPALTNDGRTVPARGAAATTDTAVSEPGTAATWNPWELTPKRGRSDRAEAPRTDGPSGGLPSGGLPSSDVEDAFPAPLGRAARRRQMARRKKHQRRAVVATAVALVGGGLTVAAMDRQSTDRTQAATAPPRAGTGTPEEQTTKRTGLSSPRPDTDRSSRTPSADRPETDDTRRQRADAPDGATAPRTNTPTAPRPQTTPPSSDGDGRDTDGAGTAANQAKPTPPSPPAADDAGSGTSETSPSPELPTSLLEEEQLCLLGVCLGGN